MAAKITAQLYVQDGKDSTIALTNHIAKNIDLLNRSMAINIVRVTHNNIRQLQKMGVTMTPLLVISGRRYTNMTEIIKLLTPDVKERDNSITVDDSVRSWYGSVLATGDETAPEDMTDADRRERMEEMQKRRSVMLGVADNQLIKGGRPLKQGKAVNREFANDDDFRLASGIDEQVLTPSKEYDVMDGERILEEHMNELADEAGRKPNKKPIRWQR